MLDLGFVSAILAGKVLRRSSNLPRKTSLSQ